MRNSQLIHSIFELIRYTLRHKDRVAVKNSWLKLKEEKEMNKTKWIVGLSIAGVMALSGTAFALTSGSGVVKSVGQTLGFTQTIETTAQSSQLGTPRLTIATPSSPNNNSDPVTTPRPNGYGGGYGMMGGFGANGYGGGYRMMGGGYDAKSLGVELTNGEVTTSDQAVAIAKAYIQKLNQDVVVAELHEFANGYEVELKEGATGAKAYEVMVYKNGGQIIAEMGPNIMWNTKYGAMNWGNNGVVRVSEEQAAKSAQEFVAKLGQGYSIGKPELAPGYYEFMVQKDGKDYAELDVNGYTGQVWFENWQGAIIKK
jgi:hypothetical protein